jgi:hypothetical protein
VLLKPDPRTAVSGGVALTKVFDEAELPRVLTELRKQAATPVRSELDVIRARCVDRITCSAVVVGMCDSVV